MDLRRNGLCDGGGGGGGLDDNDDEEVNGKTN